MITKFPFHIIILGPQGSGKGTQAEFLAKKYHLPNLAAGVLIRKKAQEKSKEGKLIKEISEAGRLIPHKLIKKLFEEALKSVSSNKAVIFDGYPRAMEQYPHLLEILAGRALKEKRALLLNIADETVYKRLIGRKTCLKCEKIYHPPKSLTLKKCTCGGKLIQRADDNKEAINERLKIYHQETDKIISLFKKNKELIEVNGEPPILEVTKEVDKKIQEAIAQIMR